MNIFMGLPGFLGGGGFVYVFFSPIRNDPPPPKAHKQKFAIHPVPGQSRKYVYVNVFLLLPAPLQKLVGDFLGFLGWTFGTKFGGNFAGLFLDPTKIKAQINRGKFRSILREKTRASEKIFRANFILQTGDPNLFFPWRGSPCRTSS